MAADKYKYTKDFLMGKIKKGDIPDFTKVKDIHAIYIFGGLKDPIVPKEMQFEQAQLFESVPNFKVKKRYEPEFDHWFMEQSVAGVISHHVYDSLINKWWNRNGNKPYKIDNTYLDEGLLGKWDQQTLLDKMNKDSETKAKDSKKVVKKLDLDSLGLRKWGFYYVPKNCADKYCPIQLLLHGCTRPAEEMIKYWGPMAAKNGILLVAP